MRDQYLVHHCEPRQGRDVSRPAAGTGALVDLQFPELGTAGLHLPASQRLRTGACLHVNERPKLGSYKVARNGRMWVVPATAGVDQLTPFRCTMVNVRSRRNQSFAGTRTAMQQRAHVSHSAATGQSLRLGLSENTCLSCICDTDRGFCHRAAKRRLSGHSDRLPRCRQTAAFSTSRRGR